MAWVRSKEKQRENNRRYYAANREREKARAQAWREQNPDRPAGAVKAWRKANPDKVYEGRKSWAMANPEKVAAGRLKRRDAALAKAREYKARNKEILKAKRAAYLKDHPEVNRANIARYNAAMMMAIPPWADHAKIRAIYAEAARLTRSTGIRHEVDHIYPLRSKVMCGLHVETNLQILTMTENRSKSNRRWPGCEAGAAAMGA